MVSPDFLITAATGGMGSLANTGRLGYYGGQTVRGLNMGYQAYNAVEGVHTAAGGIVDIYEGNYAEGLLSVGFGGLQAWGAASDLGRTAQQFGRAHTAHSFMKHDMGWTGAKIDGHMKGIDVTQPVSIEALPEGQKMIQYMNHGYQGSYYGLPGATPGQLGISGKDRVLIEFVTTGKGQALKGTARHYSGTFNGKVPFFKAQGGGTQYIAKPKSVSIRGK